MLEWRSTAHPSAGYKAPLRLLDTTGNQTIPGEADRIQARMSPWRGYTLRENGRRPKYSVTAQVDSPKRTQVIGETPAVAGTGVIGKRPEPVTRSNAVQPLRSRSTVRCERVTPRCLMWSDSRGTFVVTPQEPRGWVIRTQVLEPKRLNFVMKMQGFFSSPGNWRRSVPLYDHLRRSRRCFQPHSRERTGRQSQARDCCSVS